MEQVSAFFKLLGEPIRLRLIALFLNGGSYCVCVLVDVLNLPQSTVSRHLSQLRKAGLLLAERRGTWMHYRLNPDLPAWQQHALEAIRQLQHRDTQLLADQKALQQVLCSDQCCPTVKKPAHQATASASSTR
ncbi:MAG TPA: metalloregulator ArsR/SmtB family transcription factor [Sulfurivirga caldicuralii]|nr:metalloregulator ArsR/SmtB family transcription factor [Sulfurivirga caldicuralii]